MTTPGRYASVVAAGVQFMHAKSPGWWRADDPCAIDVDALDMGDGSMCVLGQHCPLGLRGDGGEDCYFNYANELSGIDGWDWNLLGAWGIPYGFTLSATSTTEADWRELAAEWKRAILQLRTEAAR